MNLDFIRIIVKVEPYNTRVSTRDAMRINRGTVAYSTFNIYRLFCFVGLFFNSFAILLLLRLHIHTAVCWIKKTMKLTFSMKDFLLPTRQHNSKAFKYWFSYSNHSSVFIVAYAHVVNSNNFYSQRTYFQLMWKTNFPRLQTTTTTAKNERKLNTWI